MPGTILAVVLGGVLAGSAVLKLAAPRRSRLALATFGLEGAAGWVAWASLIAAELVLAVAVIAGSEAAAIAAASLMAMMAAVIGSALLRGLAGQPCGCFGAAATVSGGAVARNLALAAGFAVLPLLPWSGAPVA